MDGAVLKEHLQVFVKSNFQLEENSISGAVSEQGLDCSQVVSG